jgi:hypothetical protein
LAPTIFLKRLIAISSPKNRRHRIRCKATRENSMRHARAADRIKALTGISGNERALMHCGSP